MEERIIHELVQGTEPWDQFRLEHDGASEAAAMLGLSKNTTRTELLAAKKSGSVKEFSDFVQKRILDRGHEVEALARPIIEEIIGDQLYPTTVSRGRMSASCDGLTMDDAIAFEHKQWNVSVAGWMVIHKRVPDEHMPQCQQILMVTGAEKLIFVMSDGTRENMVYVWVMPDPEWFKRLQDGWAQFHEDLAAYDHVEVLPAPVAAVQPSLPAVVVNTHGAITVQSNLPAFALALQAYIKTIPVKPSTDQEFADAEAACGALKKAEGALVAAEESALSSMADVEEMRRVVGDLHKLARDTRLATEKLVAARKESIRFEIRDQGIADFAAHIATLNKAIGRAYMPEIETDFGKAIKNKRTVESLRDAVNTELARAKIAANDMAARIQINMAYLRENATDYVALFPDTATIVLKAPDDLQSLVKARIAEHKDAEAKKEAAIVHRANCNARINVIRAFLTQAQAKTASADVSSLIEQCQAVDMQGFGDHEPEAIAAQTSTLTAMRSIVTALLTAEQRQADVAKATAPIAVEVMKTAAPSDADAVTSASQGMRVASGYLPAASARTAPAAPAPQPEAKPDTLPTLRLGLISDRLGFTVTGELLKGLGFEPSAIEKRAMLFHESEFEPICRALIEHIESAIEAAADAQAA